jgi:hypothetical protein
LPFGDEVAARGWSTGAVVPPDMVLAIAGHLARPGGAPVEVAETDWLVVVSQACDVVARKLEAEPFVEVLHCRPLKKPRPQYRDFRSTRILDFRPNRETHDEVALTAHAVADRYLLPRELLRDQASDGSRRLSNDAARRVLAWYALRAGRPSWPDAFVRRIDKDTMGSLEQALEPLKDDIAEVRVGIAEQDEELDDDQPYHVAVHFIVDQEVWDGDVEGRAAINAAFAMFASKLNGCNGIEVNQELSDVVSGAEFTWQEVRATDEWNFANLSNREP